MAKVQAAGKATLQFLSKTRPMLIDGKWHVPADGAAIDSINPADGSVLGRLAVGGTEEVELAVAAARRSVVERRWSGISPSARSKILWRVAELIERDGEELAEIETLDAGKIFSTTRQGDVGIAAEAFRYHPGGRPSSAGNRWHLPARATASSIATCAANR